MDWNRSGANTVPLGDLTPDEVASVHLFGTGKRGKQDIRRRLMCFKARTVETAGKTVVNEKGEETTPTTSARVLDAGAAFSKNGAAIVFATMASPWPPEAWTGLEVVAKQADGTEVSLGTFVTG